MSQTTLSLDNYPELLTASDLAALLRVHRQTICHMHLAGELPTPRVIRRQQRWGREEIRQWWDAGCPGRAEWDERRRIARK